jgi:hypothetical protein
MKLVKRLFVSIIPSVCSLALLYPAVSLAATTNLKPSKPWIAPPGQADGAETQRFGEIAPLGALLGSPVYTPPAGTILYVDNGVTECRTLYNNSADWIDVFGGDIPFTTGQATQAVEVNFNAQAAIGSGTVDNRINFRCLISQDNGVTWSQCGTQGSTNGVVLARRVLNNGGRSFTNQTNSGTYIGHSLVNPGAETQLRLQAKHLVVDPLGANSTLCYPNVVIRY